MTISGNLIQIRGDARLHGVNAVQEENLHYIWRAIEGTELSVCIVTSDSDQDLQIETSEVASDFDYHDFEVCPMDIASNMCQNRGKNASTGIEHAYGFCIIYVYIVPS